MYNCIIVKYYSLILTEEKLNQMWNILRTYFLVTWVTIVDFYYTPVNDIQGGI